MKKFLLTFIILFFGLSALATEKDDVLVFFHNFVRASNSYSFSVLNMYSKDAKIIRQVIKPNGQLVNVNFSGDEYRKQMKISVRIAKIRKYKNFYSDIDVTKVSDGYKVSAVRKPSLSDDRLKMYMIIQKQPSGKWLIVEESMQTREQIFLKYAK